MPKEAQEQGPLPDSERVEAKQTGLSGELAALISTINIFSRRLSRRLVTQDPDFRIGDWLLLKRLSRKSPAQMAELARQMGVSRQRAQKQVSELAARGFVAVEGDPKDERRKRVALTGEGRMRLDQMDTLIELQAAELPSSLLAAWRVQLQQLAKISDK